MFESPSRRVRRAQPGLAPVFAAALIAFLAGGTAHAAQDAPVLTGVEVAPEGHLLRVTLRATGPLETFTLRRQGPPNARDLVIELDGVSNGVSVPPTDTTDASPSVPYKITPTDDKTHPGLEILIERAGDSLVSFDHGAGGAISLVLIPPESKHMVSTDAYRIGADDVLAISVFGHDDLTKTMKVSPDGLINFPLIGNVHAAGRSVDDVAEEIQDRLAQNFLVDPHVTVSVWEYLSQWVNVVGAVLKPGRYYMTGPMTVIDALSQAGGVSSEAGDTVQITRRPQESDPAAAGKMITISAASVMGQSGSSALMRLRPGDVVNVLSNDVIRVEGEVRNPGPLPAGRNMTLTRAIEQAGGFTAQADKSGVEVQRGGGGEARSLTFDVEAILAHRQDDPTLQAGDEVRVRRR